MASNGVEEPQLNSIQARIAALNLGQMGRGPGAAIPVARRDALASAAPSTCPEPPLNRPGLEGRRHTANVPPSETHGSGTSKIVGNEPNGPQRNGILPPPTLVRLAERGSDKEHGAPPQLPPRRSSSRPPPTLPPRRPSGQAWTRRDSAGSVSSAVSSTSGLSTGTAMTSCSRSPSMDGSSQRMRAPAYDPSSLPPLPAKREKADGKAQTSRTEPSKASEPAAAKKPPSLPPRLPARRAQSSVEDRPPPEIKASIAPKPKRSILSMGFNNPEPQAPAIPAARPSQTKLNWQYQNQEPSPTPPPVPLASRPKFSNRQNTSSTVSPSQPSQSPTFCMKCRDFSGPDTHATKFPRETLPQTNTIPYLAQALTSPFPSHTDKARAIFTWLHHNIRYNTQAFFNHSVQPSTPSSTLMTGLAVCEGFAALYTALATHAGLESFVIGGHGKGYGYRPLSASDPLPPYEGNHAWNVVRIDEGEWKLIDPTWGAGHIEDASKPYQQVFHPTHFTMSNDDFGIQHFPSDRAHFFRSDARALSWEEYMLLDAGGANVQMLGSPQADHGLDERSFVPHKRDIPLHPLNTNTNNAANAANADDDDDLVHFGFSQLCPHWSHTRHGHGLPYVFILMTHGRGAKSLVPFSTDAARANWWLDVPRRSLGAGPGQQVLCYAVNSFDGRDGRGVGVDEFRRRNGKVAMGFVGVASWVLV
ncbi:MAG: hypothetical protein M1819_000420 [Sarea resinae]|nr:MAG: hypothetical protein M1819_000420 [Sarea resinae]